MKKYICNPINLPYRYQVRKSKGSDHAALFREAADPSVILFNGVYYMFASVSGGFWYSEDLCGWTFKETPELPVYDYAPDIREINGALVFSASKMDAPCSFYRSRDPLHEPFQAVATAFPFWDPNLFQDDDGRVYFYWGCSDSLPIYGVEVDAETFAPLGEKAELLRADLEHNGWERPGEDFRSQSPANPWIEGAYMTKHQGLYYLQYAAPGTKLNTYGDSVYVSSAPLGPYTVQKHNPFSLNPGGFISGAGHGSTFQDTFGNWFHASTMRISVHDPFERRIGIFPCEFDDDGILHCMQAYADYPYSLPDAPRGQGGEDAEWMLLSYRKPVTVSSFQQGHEAENCVDEEIRTWWMPDDDAAWCEVDLEAKMTVCAVQVNFADCGEPSKPLPDYIMREEFGGMFSRHIITDAENTEYLLEGSIDRQTWVTLRDQRKPDEDVCHDFVALDSPMPLRYIRIRCMKMPFQRMPAISGLRVFGKGGGAKPQAVTQITGKREGMDLTLSWSKAADATGYCIRYGQKPDKLYSSWRVYGKTELMIGSLSKNADYFVAIDSFNENGITQGCEIYKV